MNHAMEWMRRLGLPIVAASALLLTPSLVGADSDIDGWTSAGQNIQNTRANLLEHKINRSNVGKLGVKWVFATQGDVTATPSVDKDSVYARRAWLTTECGEHQSHLLARGPR